MSETEVRITTEQDVESQYAQINHWLQRRTWWRLLPGDLETQFRQQYDQRASESYTGTLGNVIVFTVALAAAVFILVGFSDLGAWVYVYGVFVGSIALGWGMASTQLFHRHYQKVVVSIAFGPTVLALLHPVFVTNPELRMLVHQGTIYVMLLLFLGLNLRVNYSAAAAFLALVIGYLYMALLPTPVPVEWYLSLSTAFGGAGMGLILAVRDEGRLRRVFMHERILQLDNVRIQQLANSLKQLSYHDSLTGLANRRAFNEEYERACRIAFREQKPLAVILLDVDFFKRYNDHYGHPAGDQVLAQIGEVLAQQARRPQDLACRFGGEEFLLMLPGVAAEDATQVAQRTLQEVQNLQLPHEHSSCSPFISMSAGVVSMIPEAPVTTQLVQLADKALYQAKAGGRNCWVLLPEAVSLREVGAGSNGE